MSMTDDPADFAVCSDHEQVYPIGGNCPECDPGDPPPWVHHALCGLLTHEQIVAIISEHVRIVSDLPSADAITVEIRPDCTWEAEGKNEYRATVKVEVRS